MTTPADCGDPIHAGMTCDEYDASLEGDTEPPLWVLDTSDGERP